ncbi:Short-chain dehydrogenase/reductase SDR like protein, partial [Aduncisulcus paluster]
AAICKELGLPLRFPGTPICYGKLAQVTDSSQLARGSVWAAQEADGGEAYNLTNGDIFRWSHLWKRIAAHLEMDPGEPMPISLSEMMADKAPLWDRIKDKYGLQDVPFDKIAAWGFGDFIFNCDWDVISSTTKIRQAGFEGYPMSNIRGLEHIGITVPDHDEAVAFFTAAFGAEEIISQTRTNGGPIPASDVSPMNGLRAGTSMVKVSILRLRNGPNVELFEIDRPGGTPDANIADFGISHFSVNVEDVDTAIRAFEAAGGGRLSDPYNLGAPEDGPGNRGVFGRAPWGLLVEIQQLPATMTYLPDAQATRWHILILGGSSGIGFGVAQAVKAAGARVTIASRSQDKVDAAAEKLGAKGVTLDTGDAEALEAFFAERAFDHVFCSAASTKVAAVRELPLEDAYASFQSKFWGAYRVARAANIRVGGSLTLISGFLSVRPKAGAAIQGAINAGLEGLTRGLALELA